MQARTKLQREIVYLSNTKLSILNRDNEVWAYNSCLQHIAYATKHKFNCLTCGEKWNRGKERKKCVCPSCDRTLSIINTKCLTYKQWTYFCSLEVVNDFQVIRYFKIVANHKVGREVFVSIDEISQHWLSENGKYEIYAKLHKYNGYLDYWKNEFAIRRKIPNYYGISLYDISVSGCCPDYEVLPKYRKLGFKGNFGNVPPLNFFMELENNNRFECLLKRKEFALLSYYFGSRGHLVDRFWKTICITFRNGYKIKDLNLWFDYLEILQNLGLDCLNAHYVCPNNLEDNHTFYLARRQRRDERQRKKDLIASIQSYEPTYYKEKSKYFDIELGNDEIQISVIRSVQDFYEEGKELNHCVFTNGYYKREYSLILSAKIEGKRIETIEVSLTDFNIVQSRGLRNSKSEYHDKIIDLVNQNLSIIKHKIA